uniref:Iris-B n=1 Tax=Drosophila mimetica TaxID=30038 RepID=Q38PS5_9MUSC|nr:Iris-B [Drosophila mimetica]
MRSKIKFLFMVLIITKLSSLHSAESTRIDKSVNPMYFTEFNNNLGTFIEFKGQVNIKTGTFEMQIRENFQAMEMDHKYLQDICHKYYQNNCPEPLNPDLTEFRETIKNLDTVDGDLKRLPVRYSLPYQTVKDIIDNMLIFNIFKGSLFTWNIARLASDLQSRMELLLRQVACARNNTICLSKESFQYIENAHVHRKFKISDFIHTGAVKVGKCDQNVVFQYTMPSTSDNIFNLYHLTPIPKVHSNGTIEMLDIESPYVGIDDQSKMYFNLQNLNDCLKLNSNTLICHPDEIFDIDYAKDLPCAVAAIRNQTSKTCTSHLIMRNSIWSPLLAPNSWMATVTKELSLQAICSEDEQMVRINGAGILRIRSDCRVLGTPVRLQGSLRKWEHSNQSYASLQTTNETLEVADMYASLNELRNAIVKLTTNQDRPETIVQPYIIGACGFIIIILGAACCLCRRTPVPRLVVQLKELF